MQLRRAVNARPPPAMEPGVPAETEVAFTVPTRVQASFRLHNFGPLDPSFRFERDRIVQALNTPEGPAVLEIRPLRAEGEVAAHRVRVLVHGAGGDYLVGRAERILGADDRPEAFVPQCAPTRRLVRAAPGLRLTRAASPYAMLISIVFQQRVAFRDAALSYRHLVRKFGTTAPGDFGLVVPPTPRVWARIPLHEFTALDVDRKRVETVRRVARIAGHIDRMFDEAYPEVDRKLSCQTGLGPWTVQNFLGFGFAHPDALPTGDYDLPHRVSSLFTGKPRSNDEEMARILEPYRGHRFRIIRMIDQAGVKHTRMGPRGRAGPRQRSYRS